MRKFLVAGLAVALVLAPHVAFASGFKVAEQGAKGAGMGIAFVAQADDPTTIAMNPAGMHQLPGTQAAVTSALIYAPGQDFDADVATEFSERADDQLFFVPSFYITSDFGFEKFHFGLGVYTMFGLSRDWDDVGMNGLGTAVGAAVPPGGFARNVSRVDLTTIFVNPVWSYDLMEEKLSVAAGFIYGYGKLEINSIPVVGLPAVVGGVQKLANLNQEAAGDGYSFNVGLHSSLMENRLRLGAYYRHKMALDLADGTFRARNGNPLVFGAGAGVVTGRFSTDLDFNDFTLPGTAGFGFAYQLTPDLLVEVDGEYNTWSVFEEINANLGTPLTSAGGAPLVTSATLSQNPDWDDSWAGRVGAAYKLNDKITVRIGYFYDETPVPDDTLNPSLPDQDRHGLTLGAGMTDDWWSVDLAYMAVFQEDRDVNNTILAPQNPVQNGTYSYDPIHVFMITSGIKF